MVSEPTDPQNLDFLAHHHATRFREQRRQAAMEDLSPESKAIYDLLMAETQQAYEQRFLDHKKQILDSVKKYVDETNKQFRTVHEAVDAVHEAVGTEIAEARTSLESDLEKVQTKLSAEISQLSTVLDRVNRPIPNAAAGGSPESQSWRPGVGAIGPEGHRSALQNRGTASALHAPPPGGGTNSTQLVPFSLNSSAGSTVTDRNSSAPRVELPQFDGANPKLWQRRCEDYFRRWSTPSDNWVSYGSSQFTGAAATWLESFLTKNPSASWSEFVAAVQARFMRNQRQTLLRQMYRISQTSTVADYVQRFSELVDQINAYEAQPDSLHFLTRFLHGLVPAVRVLVAIQQPDNLDLAYTLALLYEELGDGCNPFETPTKITAATRRAQYSPPLPPQPPPRWVSKTVEEKRQSEGGRSATDEKWANLKAYRRAKGLCFTCGEKYSKEHVCQKTIPLHVVQEMLNCMQTDSSDDEAETQKEPDQLLNQMMLLSTEAVHPAQHPSQRTMLIKVTVQDQPMVFLLDSGSSACFLDSSRAEHLKGKQQLPRASQVQVAGGDILQSTDYIPELTWSVEGQDFCDSFRILPLKSYDGIIGYDWLAKHSPMITHWTQQWLAFEQNGQLLVLHGEGAPASTHAMLELHLIRENVQPDKAAVQPEIQSLLEEFAVVFEQPVGLPPRRQYDHQIPLIPGARPVSMRPYRLAPELKTELERQIQEMLDQGVITHSNSAYASPVILVKKGDEAEKARRLVIDFRQLNALTVKGKYPLPVIDELLDELSGSSWFSKLDLRAGYHQIRLAPGEEHKTAFQTHNGHYEFKVMAFGLTGAPATFQFAMNAALAPVLRKFAIIFFDDILIYSRTYEEHLSHIRQVLEILRKEQWKVKLSKCDFAKQSISYLGHVISTEGVSTDPSKIETICNWPRPMNLKELRGILGMSGYYRKFIEHYAILSQPLTQLLKKGALFVWTEAQETAFQVLKQALSTAPVLALPDFNTPFVVETDACDVGIGAVLSQKGHPIAYVSRALGPRNRGLSVYEKEYLAILLAVQQWRPYLQLREFVIRTDHKSLTHLTDQRLHTDWQQKALTKMMGLQYTVQYKKGIHNGAADALSRKPVESSQLMAATVMKPVWLERVANSYAQDQFVQQKMQKLALDPTADAQFKLVDGLLRYQGRIWIGADPDL